ncbi:hypothetical protein FQN54_009749 [Arachnomyces sp. PD_36]|nr:hypothetical protein FQN54_009749 [Arachnomyces sp. PD_36]
MQRQLPRRRRPARSCLECRRRKIKCDRNVPCRHCVSTQSQCTYSVYGSNTNGPIAQHSCRGSLGRSGSTPPTATLPAAVQARPSGTSPSDGRDNHRVQSGVTEAAPVQNDDLNVAGLNASRPSDRTQCTESDLQNLVERVQKLEECSTSTPPHRIPEVGREILTRQSALQNVQDSKIVVNKTRTSGWILRMDEAQEFEHILACFSETLGNGPETSFQGNETRTLVFQSRDLLQKCKGIARRIKVGRPSRCLSGPKFDHSPLSRQAADRMAALYFQSFESTHRVLHAPSFWVEYQRYWDDPESVTIDLRLKILLVVGIGSSLYEHEDGDARFRNMVSQWIYGAQTWLSGPLEKDRLSIAGLQIHCLTIIARQIFSIGGDLVWMSMGSLVHRAMQIGLHRDPKNLQQMSVLHAELRRRLWFTILEMAVQSSLDSAMPPRISFDEFDTEAPSNNNDDEIDESIMELQPHPKSTYTSTSIQLILIDSLRIRLRVLQLLTNLRSELSYVDVLALSSNITDAYRAGGHFLKEHEGSGVTTFHRNLFDHLVRRFMIPLHSPFVIKARTNPLFYYSLNVSVDLGISISSPEPDEAFSRLMTIGGGFLREGFIYAGAILCFEYLAQVEIQRREGTLNRKSHHKEPLEKAVKALLSLSSERIRQGETTVKSHMFLSMVMAQAQAIETGAPVKVKIAQSAKDSLEYCHNLLQARAEILSLTYADDPCLEPSGLQGVQGGSDFDLDLDFFLPDAGFY